MKRVAVAVSLKDARATLPAETRGRITFGTPDTLVRRSASWAR